MDLPDSRQFKVQAGDTCISLVRFTAATRSGVTNISDVSKTRGSEVKSSSKTLFHSRSVAYLI